MSEKTVEKNKINPSLTKANDRGGRPITNRTIKIVNSNKKTQTEKDKLSEFLARWLSVMNPYM